MEATKQVKFDEVLDKCIDMSKIQLDTLKTQINTKIYDIFQIQDFVYNELKLLQFICPMKIHIHMTEYLNGPLVKQFICELWSILIAAEESATAMTNDTVQAQKDEILSEVIQPKHTEPTKNEILRKVFQTKLRKDAERSRSRKQDKTADGGKEPLAPPTTLISAHKPQEHFDIEKDVKLTDKDNKHREKHNQSSRSTSSQNSGTVIKPIQCIGRVIGGKQPLVPTKTFSSSLKLQRRIDISKIKLDVLKPWITKKITDILQREDNAVVEFVYNKLKQDKMLCPQKLQIRIAGFLNGGKAQKFVNELWPLLLSAQDSKIGIPAELEQQQNNVNMKIENDIKHDGSASVISTKPHPTKTASTLSSKQQQLNKENNKNSINIENPSSKQGKPESKDKQVDKNKRSKRSPDCLSHTKSSSKMMSSQSSKGCSDDSKSCGSNGFANICMFSPKKLQQETKAILQDQPEFLSEYSAETDEFLTHWNKAPDKEIIRLSEKFVYPDALFPPPSSLVSNSDQEQQKRNIDFGEVVKAGEEIKAALELQACKRSHSTMVNESKKLKINFSDKGEQQPPEKKQTKAKKSSPKHSSDKDSSRKPKSASSKRKTNTKYSKDIRERDLKLFGSCSGDEEACDEDSVTKLETKSKEKKSNNELHKLEMDLFGSISSDEEERSPKESSARILEDANNNKKRERSTLELDLSISSDEDDV